MGYEIGIVDGDLAQALRGLSDKYLQIVLLYYIVGLNDREKSGRVVNDNVALNVKKRSLVLLQQTPFP